MSPKDCYSLSCSIIYFSIILIWIIFTSIYLNLNIKFWRIFFNLTLNSFFMSLRTGFCFPSFLTEVTSFVHPLDEYNFEDNKLTFFSHHVSVFPQYSIDSLYLNKHITSIINVSDSIPMSHDVNFGIWLEKIHVDDKKIFHYFPLSIFIRSTDKISRYFSIFLHCEIINWVTPDEDPFWN